jgi:microcystin-dependent protein
MAMPATTRMHLPGPAETDPADVPADIDALRQAIDAITAIYGQGLANARPAPGIAGRFYFATDLRTLYYDDGQTWQGAAATPGDLRVSAAHAPGVGWLLCDGTAYGRADPNYAALYAVIGTDWGAGDGSSTFNVPDLRGRALLGAGTGTAAGATAHALGSQPTSGPGGEERHVLTIAELPSHAHPSNPTIQASGGAVNGGPGSIPTSSAGPTASAPNLVIGNVQAVGGGGALNIMSPYAAVNVFIKT